MKKPFYYTFLLFVLLCVSCNNSTQSDSEDSLEEQDEQEDLVEDSSIQSLSFNVVSPIVLSTGDIRHASLIVELADGTIVKNVTSSFVESGTQLGQTVLWFSNNQSIISVDSSGQISALKSGSTTVKATIGKISEVLDIVVKEAPQELSHIDFYQKDILGLTSWDPLTLTFDAEFTDGSFLEDVEATDLNNFLDCDLNFKSYDTHVLVVDQAGQITPVGEGDTWVTVRCGSQANILSVTISNLPTVEEPEEEPEDELIQSIRVTIDVSNWVVGDARTLLCEIQFNTGTVSSISDTFVTPDGNLGSIWWESRDETILSIDGGRAQLNAYGETFVTVHFEDFADSEEVEVKMAPEDPDWSGDSFLSANDDYIIFYGTNGGFSSHLFPNIVYGLPQDGGTHVVSFGGGGYLLITLNDYVIVDGPGVDFTIFENAVISNAYGNFMERAQVYVSEDDFTYYDFPCNALDVNEVYEGCAGINPVNALENPLNPEVSGGDSYDLADFGLSTAKYVLIVDMNTCTIDDPTYYTVDGDLLCGFSGQQGFDLDAIAIINGVNE